MSNCGVLDNILRCDAEGMLDAAQCARCLCVSLLTCAIACFSKRLLKKKVMSRSRPLRSFCYWMPYDDVPENFDDIVREAVGSENEPPEFRPSKGLSLEDLLERGRAGTLRVFGCAVSGKAWANEARPVVFEHDGGSELD